MRGSSHISTMSRSVIGLHWVRTGPKPDMNDPRRMDVLKTNLCRYPQGIRVRFQPMQNDPGVAEIAYGAAPEGYRAPTRQDECAGWLLGLLEEHSALSADRVVTMGRQAGFSRATIFRARRQLGPQVGDTRGPRLAHNKWSLPEGPEADA